MAIKFLGYIEGRSILNLAQLHPDTGSENTQVVKVVLTLFLRDNRNLSIRWTPQRAREAARLLANFSMHKHLVPNCYTIIGSLF